MGQYVRKRPTKHHLRSDSASSSSATSKQKPSTSFSSCKEIFSTLGLAIVYSKDHIKKGPEPGKEQEKKNKQIKIHPSQKRRKKEPREKNLINNKAILSFKKIE